MGRPKKADEEKRHALSIRLDGRTKEALEKASDAAQRSLGAEAERRILVTLGLDETGLEVVSRIAGEIAAIQHGKTKPWHADLKLWSAVAEMMRSQPPEATRPDKPADDEFFAAAMAEHERLRADRRDKLGALEALGLSVPEEPFRFPTYGAPVETNRAESGNGQFLEALVLGNSREVAKRTLETFPDSPARQQADNLLSQVLDLDKQINNARDRLDELLAPFREAEQEGRSMYRKRLQDEAKRRQSEGQPYNYLHSIGSFEWPFVSNA